MFFNETIIFHVVYTKIFRLASFIMSNIETNRKNVADHFLNHTVCATEKPCIVGDEMLQEFVDNILTPESDTESDIEQEDGHNYDNLKWVRVMDYCLSEE